MTRVRIQPSFLLNQRFELPEEGLEKVIEQYKKKWKSSGGDKIVPGLEKVTGLAFAQNIIDAYIVNVSKRGNISNPLIIGGKFKPKEFVHVLIHELVHILAEDNTQGYNWHKVAGKLYPKKEKMVAYHIMTHAITEALYTDVLKKPDWVIWLIQHPDIFGEAKAHAQAWEIVDQKGYKEILKQFKESSSALPEDKLR